MENYSTQPLFFIIITIISFLFSLQIHTRYPEADFYLLPSRLWQLGSGGILALLLLESKSYFETKLGLNLRDKNGNYLDGMLGNLITLVDKETGLVLGAHLIGPDAGEMINMFVMAMCGKLPCETLKGMIFSYPSWGSDIKAMI